jgi:2-dehydropantoate 2-reductase
VKHTSEKSSVVVVGAGAIGSSITGWIAPKYDNLFLLARRETLEVIKNRGLKTYIESERSTATALPVHAIGSLAETTPPDIIVITVKNYDLDNGARDLRAQLGNHEPIVVALQNGVHNQQVLPKYFTRVVYGVVCYSAWREGPGEVGHDPRGYIILGTPANDLQDEVQTAAKIFRLGLDCVPTDRLQDAAHCKLVINQANALMTLVGVQKRPIKSFNVLMHMTFKLWEEGIQLLQATGFHEHALGHNPSWRFIKTSATLPSFITGSLFRLNTRRLGLNSMAQDVFGGRNTTELETLNGYMLNLARQIGFPTPINETVYEVAKERFRPDFQPMSEQELWDAIQQKLRSMKPQQTEMH